MIRRPAVPFFFSSYSTVHTTLEKFGKQFSFTLKKTTIRGHFGFVSEENLGKESSVHTLLQEFENAALFLRLSLPSTLIRHENGVFRKRSPNRRYLKTPALCFSVDGGGFRKRASLRRLSCLQVKLLMRSKLKIVDTRQQFFAEELLGSIFP